VTPEPRPYLVSDDTPLTSCQIHSLGWNKTLKTQGRYSVIDKRFKALQQTVAAHTEACQPRGRISSGKEKEEEEGGTES
jgi:hypothetical protein